MRFRVLAVRERRQPCVKAGPRLPKRRVAKRAPATSEAERSALKKVTRRLSQKSYRGGRRLRDAGSSFDVQEQLAAEGVHLSARTVRSRLGPRREVVRLGRNAAARRTARAELRAVQRAAGVR